MSRRRLSVPGSAYIAACCDVSLLVQETGCSATSPISDLVIKHCLKGGAVEKSQIPRKHSQHFGMLQIARPSESPPSAIAAALSELVLADWMFQKASQLPATSTGKSARHARPF